MQETQENINNLNLKSLKICVDSLIWIAENSINDAISIRAKETLIVINMIQNSQLNSE